MNKKILKLTELSEGKWAYSHYCEGCKCQHIINTDWKNDNNAIWHFNGDFEKPSFTPSINISYHFGAEGVPDERCHYFITNGCIIYQGDCTHQLANKQMPLIPF